MAANSVFASSIHLSTWSLSNCDRNLSKNIGFSRFKSNANASFPSRLHRLAVSSTVGAVNNHSSSVESLFRYDKAVPEEIIEKPVGMSLSEKDIGDNPQCTHCLTRGAVLCATCSGSGLYIDSILESQGIIVKVRCLGCGGTGNVMCSGCGGRGHLGSD